MAKKKTLKNRKKSSEITFSEWRFDEKPFLDRKRITEILVSCILEDDIESFKDVLAAHLYATSKTKLSRETGLTRKTLYDLMAGESFDPKLSTLTALLRLRKAS